jgi:hypothetical protein
MPRRRLIGARGAAALRRYKFSCEDRSVLVSPLLQPFWTRSAQLLPSWLAPNCVTVSGLLLVLLSTGLAWRLDPRLCAISPLSLLFLHAVLLFAYQALDAMDGKQVGLPQRFPASAERRFRRDRQSLPLRSARLAADTRVGRRSLRRCRRAVRPHVRRARVHAHNAQLRLDHPCGRRTLRRPHGRLPLAGGHLALLPGHLARAADGHADAARDQRAERGTLAALHDARALRAAGPAQVQPFMRARLRRR